MGWRIAEDIGHGRRDVAKGFGDGAEMAVSECIQKYNGRRTEMTLSMYLCKQNLAGRTCRRGKQIGGLYCMQAGQDTECNCRQTLQTGGKNGTNRRQNGSI